MLGLRTSWLGVLLVAVVTVAACGGSDDGEASTEDDAADPAVSASAAGDPATASSGSDGGDEGDGGDAGGPLTPVTMQLGWIASNNQLGEIVAMHKGYYEDEGIELTIEPGGPSVDGVATVASGQAQIGQLSSSPSLMLAVSQDIPIKAFAAGAQEHPYTFFSMPDTPLESAEDMAGLHVGTQATGEILLNALLAANDMSRDDLADFTAVGAEITPLLSGQVDVWTGWLTNTAQLNQLPEGHHELRLWDAGVELYGLPYYAQESYLAENPEVIEGFIRATAKGWAYARDNYDEAIDLLLEEYPNLEREAESEGGKVILDFVFTDAAQENGWGAMDPEVWQNQLDMWAQLDQFEGDVPALEQVMTTEFLDQTADDRAVD